VRDREQLAQRLGYVLLSVPWQREELLRAARTSFDGEPDWLPGLIDRLLGSIRDRPVDRPYDLAVVISGQRVFTEGLELDHDRGIRWRLGSLPVGGLADESERMGPGPWPVPPIGSERELADLLRVDLEVMTWLADRKRYLRRTPEGGLHPYRYRWLSRAGRTPRLLESPTPILRAVQRRLLDRIFCHIPVHRAAYGFVRGRSAALHATRHVMSDWVINFDLRNFFGSIREGRIRGIVRTAGYPEPVAAVIAALVSNSTPVWSLARLPAGGDVSERAALRSQLRMPHLPQGAPTSPAIANLSCFRLDRRLSGLADRLALRYTRYADDLCFSGDDRDLGLSFERLVRQIVLDEGYQLNDRKQRLERRSRRQTVTGIVVNDWPNVLRASHDQLRAILHDAVRNGPAHANRHDHPDFRAHLDGRVGWVEQLNPVRGARLRRQFDQIDWSD
jgi:hypothetical protein